MQGAYPTYTSCPTQRGAAPQRNVSRHQTVTGVSLGRLWEQITLELEKICLKVF